MLLVISYNKSARRAPLSRSGEDSRSLKLARGGSQHRKRSVGAKPRSIVPEIISIVDLMCVFREFRNLLLSRSLKCFASSYWLLLSLLLAESGGVWG